ncbi:glutamyl-tRNA synthetase [Coprinopsis cinerea okayama7|uniref:Glutamyl-tRNA synthetase n=1 Tax=Coprinopsis cinerea (strain Okayama-7 / 130 / ATCC MYA-4618 / FGSC 9003) TaxID=240176 RepID=A8N0A9_COPC7|nr:glutamyl-tRNA synthetase [Coprinopsis cinerea okayama7\|eukprot:XP_001828297.2 glutamyl-tRNA synthetase [Coprinopsis cinerea okayama7\
MALYNHLFSRKNGGKWLLRIEDTDATRFVPGSVEGIRKALDWAGLEYDYGPGKGGPHGPYFQSERLDLYRDYSKKLLESGHAYRCFCSMDRLAEVRERLARTGSNATYDRTCLHLTEEEVARRVKAGEKSIVRLNGSNLPVRPPGTDLIFGNLKDAHASLATDPILLKSDQFPTYHLASVVDDHEMGITHVLRGEEWLPSLPLHLDLYAALKIPTPKFAHLPILLNPDGSKMSKRNGDVQVEDYIRRGWEPGAVLNWLALAGWGARHDHSASEESSSSGSSTTSSEAPDSTAIYSLPELINEFDIHSVTHRNSSLDPMKLEYINKHHLLRQRSTPEGFDALAERAPYTNKEMIKRAVVLLEGRLTNLKELPIHVFYLFEEPNLESEEAKEMVSAFDAAERDQVLTAVSEALAGLPEPWEEHEFLQLLHSTRKEINKPNKMFMKTVRHALTGYKDGPALQDIIKTLGRERTLNRLRFRSQ